MIEILEFIFRNFWTYLGTLLLIGTIAGVMKIIFLGIHTGNKHYPKTNCNSTKTKIDIWHNATKNPPPEDGLYYGKQDNTNSIYPVIYKDGSWTLSASSLNTTIKVIEWAYWNALKQLQ